MSSFRAASKTYVPVLFPNPNTRGYTMADRTLALIDTLFHFTNLHTRRGKRRFPKKGPFIQPGGGAQFVWGTQPIVVTAVRSARKLFGDTQQN